MNANDVQLIMNISLNNDKSKIFKKGTNDLMKLENIIKEALDYIEINVQDINTFKLTGINNEEIKKDEDLINIAYEDKNKNLVCEIKLLSGDIKHNLNGQLSQKEKEKQNNIINNNNNSIETIKKTFEENKEAKGVQDKKEHIQNRGEDKNETISLMKNQNNNINNINKNTITNAIPAQDFNKKTNKLDNGDTLPEFLSEENIGKINILSEQSVGRNAGETKGQEVEKKIENEKKDKISSNEKILTDTEIKNQKMRNNNGTVSSNTETPPSPSKIKFENMNNVQKEKDANIPKNESVEKLIEEKNNSIITETEKNEINESKNDNSNKSFDTNQTKVQGGDTEDSIQNYIGKKDQEEKGIVNPTDYEKIKEECEKLKKENEKFKKENDENKKFKKEYEKIKEENKILKEEKDKFENQRNNISEEYNKYILKFNNKEEKYQKKIQELGKEISILKDNKKDVKTNQEESKKLSENEKIKKTEEEIPISDYKKEIENLKKQIETLKSENENLKKEKESIENKNNLLEKENKNLLQSKETKNDINNKGISSNSIKNELNLINAKRKSFDCRNANQFNEIKNEESNQNENEEISIPKLMLTIENFKKMLKIKGDKIKDLENKLKENNCKSQELKNNNKEENKEVLNEKVEQGKLNSENKNNDVKEDNIRIKNEDIYEMFQKLYDLNEKIYQNQIELNNEKKKSKEVGDTNEEGLVHTPKKIDNQNDNDKYKKDKNLNNKNDNSNNDINSFGDTPMGNHVNHNNSSQGNTNIQENTYNNQENNTNSKNNPEINNVGKNKMFGRTDNSQKNNTNLNNNHIGNQKNSNNNNLNNNSVGIQSSKINGKNHNHPFSRNETKGSENKNIDIKTGKEKYRNELKKIREDLKDIAKIFSDNYILDLLSENKGNLEESKKIIFDKYKNYQKKNK